MPNHMIFNERPECQDRVISFLQKMGYEYVSRSEAEQKRGSLSKVIFTDELIRFLNKQSFKYKNYELNFSGESIQRAVNALDASLLQGLAMASKEIYNLLTLGISVEENVVIDKDVPVRQSFDLSYIDFEHPANNIWQVTEEFSVERPNGQYARPDVVIMVNGIPLAVIECKKSSVDVKEGVLQNVRNMSPDYIPHLFKFSQMVLSMNPNKVVYGTCGTSADYFVEWREDDIQWQEEICKRCSPDGNILEQDRAIASLLDKKRFLTIIHDYILYDSNIKKICRHQQFFAVENAIKNNVSLMSLKELTGHANIDTTENYYVKENIRNYLEATYGVEIGNMPVVGTVATDYPEAKHEDIVNDGCGYCRNPECNVLGTANCLMCKGFITTPKHIAQFEEAINILSQQIVDNENPHDKEHLYAVKRLYAAYLEQLYIRKEEIENATAVG